MITGPLPTWLESRRKRVSRYTSSSPVDWKKELEREALGNLRSRRKLSWDEVWITIAKDMVPLRRWAGVWDQGTASLAHYRDVLHVRG